MAEIKFRGVKQHEGSNQANHFGITECETIDTSVVTRGAAKDESLTVDDSDLLMVEFDDGFVDFMTIEQARKCAGTRRSSDGQTFDFPARFAGTTKRGAFDWFVKTVKRLIFKPPTPAELFDKSIDVTAEVMAHGVAAWVERQFWTIAKPPGVWQVDENLELVGKSDKVAAEAEAIAEVRNKQSDPYLVLVHGTFSNTVGGFGQLKGTAEWVDLFNHYGKRVIALEQKTLSVTPVQNALDLVEKLPKGARLHLVSHSRGGLVGDLLSLPDFPKRSRDIFKRKHPETAAIEIEQIDKLVHELKDRQIKVERFVRVASPAAGTILASKRLDDLLKLLFNICKLVPSLRASPTFAFVEALAVALAGKRTDPDVMPGIEAMMPTSPYIHLLNSHSVVADGQLAVVAGDVEGSGIFKRLKVFASDLFYREDHDLVVNTKSMYQGLKRKSAVASFQKTSEVDHVTYFKNEVTRRRIANALKSDSKNWANGGPPRGFQALVSRSEGVRADNTTRAAARKGDDARASLVFVPAQLGSVLERTNGSLVWPATLSNEDDGVAALEDRLQIRGVNQELYGDLIGSLSRDFNVNEFAYDWRDSFGETGLALADYVDELLHVTPDSQDASPRKIHIVAHSGGGLAVMWMKLHRKETWRALLDRGGSVVFLGLPESGSFQVAEWLCGRGELINQLALIDPTRTKGEIGAVLARADGLLELLPQPQASGDGGGPNDLTPDFLDQSFWDELVKQCPDIIPPSASKLSKARTFRDEIGRLAETAKDASTRDGGKLMPLSKEPVFSIFGGNVRTVVGSRIVSRMDEDDDAERIVLEFLSSTTGDGFGPSPGAFFPQSQRLFAGGTHMGLVHASMADRVRAVLHGSYDLFDREPVVGEQAPPIVHEDAPVVFPNFDDLVRASMGLMGDEPIQADRRTLCVEVVHGSLEFSEQPVLVGHYYGTSLEGAEGRWINTSTVA